MTGYTTLALSDVPPAQMRTANALASTAQQLFTGLAVVLATLAPRFLATPLASSARPRRARDLRT
jgi:hypothetical protein